MYTDVAYSNKIYCLKGYEIMHIILAYTNLKSIYVTQLIHLLYVS